MANNFSYNLRKIAHLILSCIVLVTVLFLPDTISAQKNGQITGRIFDLSSKEYLPGANVIIKGTTFGAATDRSGLFKIINVPPGEYEITVSYLGYETKSISISVGTQGYTVNQDVGLKAIDVAMKEIEITGMLQGQTKALNIKKTSDNIMNVVAEEQIQSFPDINAAEVLQRIPGISIQRDQGEGRYVQVRGTQARLNLMKVNGEEIPSPERAIRNVMIDVVPADQLASIEVSKTLTPDMEGNAIGGSVNLVTKSALDYDKTVLNVTVGSGYVNLHGKGYPGSSMPGVYQANVTYGTRLGESKNIGIVISGSFLRTDRGSDNNELTWGPIELTDKTKITWGLQDIVVRDYSLRRDRQGLSGTFDFLVSEGNKLSLKAIYTQFEDSEIRQQLRVRPSKGKYTSPTVATGATFERLQRDRSQTQTITSILAKGEHDLGFASLDYSLSYSEGKEKQNWYYAPTFAGLDKVDYLLNLTDTDIPTWTITKPGANYELDATKFKMSDVRWQSYVTKNRAFATTVNLKLPYSLGAYQSELKFGGKFDTRNKFRNGWDIKYSPTSTLLMSQFIGDYKVEDFLAGSYNFGPLPDPAKIQNYFKANRYTLFKEDINRDNTDARNYETTENVLAFYAMTSINMNNLTIVTGIRNEITTDKIIANQVEYNAAGAYVKTTKINTEESYSNLLPMISAKYQLGDATNIRAAFTTGIGRPDYYDLVPYRIANDQADQISMGNKDLKPTTSYGFDLTADHFFQGIGVLSGGFFYKQLSDIIYSKIYTQSGGEYNGWLVTQPVNGGDAKLLGVEFDWQQQLNFLPGFLSGFGIYLNYTYTKSSTDLSGHKGSKLPGQSGNVGNFAITYQKYGFTAKLSINYAEKFVDVVGVDSDNDIYYDSHTQVDFSANQEIFSGLSAYVQLMNLTNAPLRYYIGDPKRPTQREYYSWWMLAGLKYSL